MDRNSYDASIDWLQQSPANKQESLYRDHQQGSVQSQTPIAAKKAAPAKQPRMPKQKALELVSSLKKGIVISSVMSFGLLSLLATGHVIGTTTSTTSTKTPVTTSSSTATATSSIASSATATPSTKKSSSSSTSSSSSSSSASFGTSSSQSSVSGTSVS
jgi:hypothetical protein